MPPDSSRSSSSRSDPRAIRDHPLGETAEDEFFRDELLTWFTEHLIGEFKDAGAIGGPADDEGWEIRVAWEKELSSGGWLGLTWPKEHGGRGSSLSQELIFAFEYARVGAPHRAGIQGLDLLGPTLIVFGSETQQRRFLPKILAVEEFWAQCLSEPDAGSDLASVRTTAVARDGEWVVNGQKVWTTFAHHADWLYVLCRTDATVPKHRGLSLLLVPRDQPGVRVRPIRNMAGSSEFNEVFFTDARTSIDMVVGELNDGWRVTMANVGFDRGTGLLAQQMAFQREMEQLIACAKRTGGLSDAQMRQRIMRAWAEMMVYRSNNLRLFESLMRKGGAGPEASIGKLLWSKWHRSLGELQMDMLGAGAMILGDGHQPSLMQKTFLNSRAETIYGGSSEIQHNIIGERVLALPRNGPG